MKQYSRNTIATATRNTINAQLFDEEDYVVLMAEDEFSAKVNALSQLTYAELLDMYGYDDEEDRAITKAICIVNEREEQEYRITNEPLLWDFYKAHKDDEDREWWDYFSDWHKDVYGVRPHYLRP
jgi:hypothetical protein